MQLYILRNKAPRSLRAGSRAPLLLSNEKRFHALLASTERPLLMFCAAGLAGLVLWWTSLVYATWATDRFVERLNALGAEHTHVIHHVAAAREYDSAFPKTSDPEALTKVVKASDGDKRDVPQTGSIARRR